ncbi:MAG: hypothetical protein ACXWT4_06165 [Methylobacter sp.]
MDSLSIHSVCCADCAWFTPDAIGDGMGPGSCEINSQWRGTRWDQELRQALGLYGMAAVLWPKVARECRKFDKKNARSSGETVAGHSSKASIV